MTFDVHSTAGAGFHTFTMTRDGAALSRAAALVLLHDDATFRASLVRALASSPYRAFFWEMPATSRAHQDRPFEFVLVDGPALIALAPDVRDFEQKFAASKDDVLAFPNLGGDAMLVVPAPRGSIDAYAHLASFVRGAPPAQVDALFAELARAIAARLSAAPLWVSTAGLGVSWLHLRLDSRPKYYRHIPYQSAP